MPSQSRAASPNAARRARNCFATIFKVGASGGAGSSLVSRGSWSSFFASIYGVLCLATGVALPVARERLPAWARQFAGVLREFSVAAMPCGTARGTLCSHTDGQASHKWGPLRVAAKRRARASMDVLGHAVE